MMVSRYFYQTNNHFEKYKFNQGVQVIIGVEMSAQIRKLLPGSLV